jgi:hypothetical protein
MYAEISGTLTLPLTQTEGSLAWYIGPLAEAPYQIHGEVWLNGEMLAEDEFVLARRGPAAVSAQGGEAQGFNGQVRVIFPAGALPETAWVTVRPPQGGQGLGGLPFELLAVGQVSGQEISQFSQPVTIEVKYNGRIRERVDEGTLTLFYYDETMKTWRPLTTQVDRQGNRLIALSDHFTLFDFQAQNWEAARLPSLEAFQVSTFTGSAAYNFSIEVPPGPGGLQPSLSLSYNSQTVDGSASRGQASWVGMGWSLDTGYIQRSMNGTPNYFEDDTFSLQVNGVGGMLLPISDQDGNPNTIDYRLADENFWRVRQYLATGNVGGYNGDVGYWVIWDKNGTQYYFGNDASGNPLAGHAWYPAYPGSPMCPSITMQTWRWSLTRVRNIFGKELTYTYYNEPAPLPKFAEGCSGYQADMAVAVYPETIIYPNGRYQVRFVRNATLRNDYDGAWNDRQSTMLYQRSQLQEIGIWHDSDGNGSYEQMVRRYVLGFGENGQQIMPGNTWPEGGQTPTLTSITEYGMDGGALPATSFYYDGLHMTRAENGYGGKIEFVYDEEGWHAADGSEETHAEGGALPANTVVDLFDASPLYNGPLEIFQDYYQPGGAYLLEVKVINNGGGTLKLGLDGGSVNYWGEPQTFPGGQWTELTSIISLPGDVSEARPIAWCSVACTLTDYRITPLVTRYRVVTKTRTDQVTGESFSSPMTTWRQR